MTHKFADLSKGTKFWFRGVVFEKIAERTAKKVGSSYLTVVPLTDYVELW